MMDDRDILGNWEDHLLNIHLDTLDVCPDCGGSASRCEEYRAPEGEGYDECAPCDDYEPDPDTMLGGHDNPYPDEYPDREDY